MIHKADPFYFEINKAAHFELKLTLSHRRKRYISRQGSIFSSKDFRLRLFGLQNHKFEQANDDNIFAGFHRFLIEGSVHTHFYP